MEVMLLVVGVGELTGETDLLRMLGCGCCGLESRLQELNLML